MIMKKLLFTIALTVAVISAQTQISYSEEYTALDKEERSIVLISAYTSNGNLEKLEPAFVKGLESGVTVNEIKEILAHLYAYVGFPRALNGQTLFMKLMDERKAEGIQDTVGKSASPVPEDLNRNEYGAKVRAQLAGLDEVPPEAKWQKFNPVMDKFLKEHLFADIFVRDVLNFKTRELVTISALASLSGTESQLRYHMNAAMNVGNSAAELKEFVRLIKNKVGAEEGKTAEKVLNTVLDSRN